MAGQGNTIGGKFEELKAIIDKVKESNRHRVGVCLDTCHIFAAGDFVSFIYAIYDNYFIF